MPSVLSGPSKGWLLICFATSSVKEVFASFSLRREGDEQFIDRGGSAMTMGEVLHAWQTDLSFQDFFLSALKGQPYDAFFWEMPPVITEVLNASFRFVAVDARHSFEGRAADPSSFQEQFDRHPKQSVVAFPNLGGDAVLVVPKPLQRGGPYPQYAHFAAFARGAPASQARTLLQELGKQLELRLKRGSPVCLGILFLGVVASASQGLNAKA